MAKRFKNPVPIPTDPKLRQFSFVMLGVCLAGILLTFFVFVPYMRTTFLELGLWSLCGAVYPFFIIPLYWIMGLLGKFMSWLTTHVILLAVFYLAFTPAAVFGRIRGRHGLAALPEKNKASYWSPVAARYQASSHLNEQH